MKKEMTTFAAMSLMRYYRKGTVRKINKWLGKQPTDPYMKFKEIEFFSELLTNLQPVRCLEYGSGISTPFFLKLLPDNAQWHSVENLPKWYDIVKAQLTSDRIHLHLVDAKEDPNQEAATDVYANFAEQLEGKFDFILVDGINRENCIDVADKYLAKNGLLVVHDANRVQYHSHIKQFKNWKIIQDFRKTAGGFGLASNDLDLEKLVSWNEHSQAWKADTNISNFFKFKFLIGGGKPFKLEHS